MVAWHADMRGLRTLTAAGAGQALCCVSLVCLSQMHASCYAQTLSREGCSADAQHGVARLIGATEPCLCVLRGNLQVPTASSMCRAAYV